DLCLNLEEKRMTEDLRLIQFRSGGGVTHSLPVSDVCEGSDLRASGSVSIRHSEFIALVESRTFIGECVRLSLQSALPYAIRTFSDAIELERIIGQSPKLILLSFFDNNNVVSENTFRILSRVAPGVPIVVLAYKSDKKIASD